MLTIIGDLVEDVIIWGVGALDHLDHGDDNPATIRRTRGGSGANVAAAAAQLADVRFIGRIGEDAVGAGLVASLESAGVDVRVQRGGATGTIVILVDGAAERTMIPDRAASGELTAIEPSWLEGTGWLHFSMYAFLTESSRLAVRDACRLLGERNIPISVDLASVSALSRLGHAEVFRLLEAVQPAVVFANEDEAAWCGARELVARIGCTVVVKHAGDPVEVYTDDGVQTVEVEPVDEVLDSTGAGDAFAAGYLAAAQRGERALDCVAAGNRLARATLTRPGAL